MGEKGSWIDISIPLKTGMAHYPGDPPVRIERGRGALKDDAPIVSRLSMSAHSGTHVDAPLHFFEKGASIDQIPFDAIVGKARVVEISDKESIKPSEIEACGPKPGEILLFKTRNSSLWAKKRFVRRFVHLSTEAAAILVRKEVRAVGIDYLSIGGFGGNEMAVHRMLLDASVWIIEGLDLSSARGGLYEFICLPLNIACGEAAPARAIIRPL